MPVPEWDDPAVFLRTDEFAITVTVALQGGATVEFPAIYDEAFLNADLGEYEIDTTRPRLTAAASDVAGVARGDEATVEGQVYVVLGPPQTDGTGTAVIPLSPRGSGHAAI